jgi:putative oxidoreductase
MNQTAIDPSSAPYAALLLRLALGVMFIAHALLKVLVFTIPGTVGFFEQVGFPGWLAYVTILGELGGGTLLVLGVYARYVARALTPLLLGALTVHLGNGWVFSAPNGGWEYPAFLAAASLVQALLGDGAFALRPAPLPRTALA